MKNIKKSKLLKKIVIILILIFILGSIYDPKLAMVCGVLFIMVLLCIVVYWGVKFVDRLPEKDSLENKYRRTLRKKR